MVDNEQVKRETANYKKLPQIIDFRDEDGNDRMQEEIQANYNRVKQEVQQIVTDEMERIKNDPNLQHLIKQKNRRFFRQTAAFYRLPFLLAGTNKDKQGLMKPPIPKALNILYFILTFTSENLFTH